MNRVARKDQFRYRQILRERGWRIKSGRLTFSRIHFGHFANIVYIGGKFTIRCDVSGECPSLVYEIIIEAEAAADKLVKAGHEEGIWDSYGFK